MLRAKPPPEAVAAIIHHQKVREIVQLSTGPLRVGLLLFSAYVALLAVPGAWLITTLIVMRPMHMIVVILATEPDLAQVVDPTGEIVLPADRRSKAWAATAGQTELGVEGLEARHIVGNY